MTVSANNPILPKSITFLVSERTGKPADEFSFSHNVSASDPDVTFTFVDQNRVNEAVNLSNNYMAARDHKLRFVYNEQLRLVVVKVMDGDTEKVIRQVPPEEMIRLAEHLAEMQDKGTLVHERA